MSLAERNAPQPGIFIPGNPLNKCRAGQLGTGSVCILSAFNVHQLLNLVGKLELCRSTKTVDEVFAHLTKIATCRASDRPLHRHDHPGNRDSLEMLRGVAASAQLVLYAARVSEFRE